MTQEKLKREIYASNFCIGRKVSRRKARKLIRHERMIEKNGIKHSMITRRTRFQCNFCGAELKWSQWLWQAGQVIRCPKCRNETMDIAFTTRVEV